ncbi:MAG: ATP-binding protein, partial [Muribaculaceae bacterium]|nr:ATP-binding protein [Muribaculaceae bacterium]
MKDLRPVRGKYYIHKLIDQGEHENQDFKYMISDARKIARSLSAFANHSGGRLLIGVKDNGTVAGVRNEEDVYMIETAAAIYCDPPQDVTFTAYKVDDSAVVVVAEIAPAATK